jgi:hypothetical protein
VPTYPGGPVGDGELEALDETGVEQAVLLEIVQDSQITVGEMQ